ncbi:NAD(P)(+) transhydrogenase (Re/Si-specific) subunit beta, partial [Caballeronia hypogeia]|uniref:NAD(P)(+) transhydrogenase (Re/Si-specific) subunit beta n=1 Tax=Caballeronia hypogeia TaxID=1777140 RepID=UPI000AA6A79D
MTSNLTTVSYIGAAILFILSLGGLANPETARRGNLLGMIGMLIAVLATVLGPRVSAEGIPYVVAALVVGGAVGLFAAKKVQMTQMPELVALNRPDFVGDRRVWRYAARAESTRFRL